MTREELKDIFQSPFSYDNWRSILESLFAVAGKNCQLSLESERQQIPVSDDDKMDGFYIGDVRFGLESVKLYTFHIKDNTTNISRNRVGISSTINYLRNYVDAAIVVYYNDNEWRVSYIYDKIANPKRFTYCFGSRMSLYCTAVERFVKLSEASISTETILEAFSVEALSKDFFNEYRVHYGRFCDCIGTKTKSNRDYVKKIMERLVFIQFLQKKGWMNGDYNYMQNLFAKSPYQANFLEEVLKPLFFHVLNTKESERNHPKLINLGAAIKIPYLNGGLFEADGNDKKTHVFTKELFNGLFDFFSHYNFTIDENDPNDAEVGVDPEMLGRIFENMLEDNKDKGAFYTPKEIVQYMCRQSLIEYLQSKLGKHTEIENFINNHDTGNRLDSKNFISANAKAIKKLLDNVKICDPAIGSGAFPMGILNELFYAKMALDMTLNRAEVKKAIIQNNIYGVDIEQGAVDIACLRFWLSLVVDENNPEPLSNLDYKIMYGNSLLSRYAMDTPINEVFAQYNKKHKTNFTLESYRQLVQKYNNKTSHDAKAEFRRVIKEIKGAFKTELSNNQILKRNKLENKIWTLESATLFGPPTKENLKEAKERRKTLYKLRKREQDIISNKLYKNSFEWRFEYPQLLDDDGHFVGFDIVIGNPPYFVYQGNTTNEIIELRKKNELKIAFGGKLNAYKLFLAKALNSLTKEGGITTFICQNSFLADRQAEVLRKYVLANTQIIAIDSFPERDSKKKRVFESIKMSVCIVLIQNTNTDNEFYVNFWNDRYKSSGTKIAFNRDEIMTIDNESCIIPRITSDFKSIIIKMKSILDQIRFKCYEGELNMTFHKHLFSKDKNNSIILKGASIQRYFYTLNMSQGEIEYLDESNYLRQYAKSEKASHHNYNRIAMQGMTGTNDNTRLVMTLIPKGIYLANSCNYIMPSEECDVKYILGVFNSKLINWYFRCFSTNSNVNGYEVDGLPIPMISKNNQKVFVEIVDKILDAKKMNSKADTSALEREIDSMVYALYNLTPEEIKIIEK